MTTDAAAEPVHVAFVRAVMIGREGLHRQVLLEIFGRAGGHDARSYISTGNVSFTAPERDVPALVEVVEAGVAEVVGRPTPVYVRRLDELEALIAADPFAESPIARPAERTVAFFRSGVPASIEVPSWSDRGDIAVVATGPREVFCVNQEVDGRLRGPGGWIQRIGGEPVTTRAWSTVNRIVDKLHGTGP